MYRSSIFNFETLQSPIRITPAALIAVGSMVLVRLVFAFFGQTIDGYDGIDDSQVYAIRRYEIAARETPPEVLVLGSSRSQYAIAEDVLAKELGLPESSVAKIAITSGGPWDALYMLRQNPELLREARWVLFDAAPWQFTIEPDFLDRRFFQIASLNDRLEMPVTQPEVTLDWFWPYFSHKREIVDWAKLIFNLSRGDEPGHRKTDYWPSWKPGATRDGIPFAEELHRAANMDPTSTHHPASYAEKTFANSPPPHPHRRLQMKRLLGRLDAADAMVVLHQPPMHPGVFTWLEEHPKARKRYEAFLDYVRSLEQDNVLVYIVEEPEEVGSTADEMIDYGHLGGEAARKYTQALAAFLKDRQKE